MLLAATAAFWNVLDWTFIKIETLDESLEWKCNFEFGIILRSIYWKAIQEEYWKIKNISSPTAKESIKF